MKLSSRAVLKLINHSCLARERELVVSMKKIFSFSNFLAPKLKTDMKCKDMR